MGGPVGPVGPVVPPDLLNRMANFVGRMASRGAAETIQVLGRQAVRDASGKAVARARVNLGSFVAVVASGGGNTEVVQEGTRAGGTLEAYFPLGGVATDTGATLASVLTRDNYTGRWLMRAGDGRPWRITAYEQFGPYCWVTIEVGGTADPAGNVK